MKLENYRDYIAVICTARSQAAAIPPGTVIEPALTTLPDTSPCVMLFAPHPDDECIIGGLPLRLRCECGMRIINVAVTHGSRVDRQSARWEELQAACAHLGFTAVKTAPNGLGNINFQARADNPEEWRSAVATIADLLRRFHPKVIFLPHAGDWNRTHIGTHWLVMDALAMLDNDFSVFIIETEYWAQMPQPNLLIESSPADVARLVEATSCHAGEVGRNPYHLSLPAWMQDNVRRGGEVVGGQGGAAPDFMFGTLYRISCWEQGALIKLSPATGVVPAGLPVDKIFLEMAAS